MPLSDDDLRNALRVLAAVAKDRGVLADASPEQREQLQRLAGEVARPDMKARRKLTRALRKKQKQARREHDEELRSQTELRQARAREVFVTPDDAARRQLPGRVEEGELRDAPPLEQARTCYVCKSEYRHLHFFYDQLCPRCGDLNFNKRSPKVDLKGRVALVTGARVKIGYQAAILLLRRGCHVVVTTRFPRDAALRYAGEKDFEQWRGRLDIYGLDLRHTPSVEATARALEASLPRLDFIIHNACQTVRRPPAFYAHLLEGEERPLGQLPEAERRLVERWEELRPSLPLAGVQAPAALSQAASADADLLPVDRDLLEAPGRALSLFPAGLLDADLQQIDGRTHNSWRLLHHEVPTTELLEVFLVNAVAPFVLTARLKPLMLRTPGREKHVVNVSAMEGQFYRKKTARHPHTNMAKAALNMLTRTSAQDWVEDGIHMNAVDTGWVTDEDPLQVAARKAQEHRFSPPLDIVDGAARIIDPIVVGLQTGEHPWGIFFKDYAPAPW